MDLPTNDSDDGDGDIEVAQALGFASFGSQNPPSKRRRYNDSLAATDLDACSAQTSAHGHGQSDSLKATQDNRTENNSAIAKDPVSEPTNAQEISLDDEDDDTPNGEDPAANGAGHMLSNASLPQRPPARTEVPQHAINSSAPDPALGGRDRRSDGSSSYGGRGNREFGSLPRGQPWYRDYYDPSTIQNPWERIERSLGLEPRDNWPPSPNVR